MGKGSVLSAPGHVLFPPGCASGLGHLHFESTWKLAQQDRHDCDHLLPPTTNCPCASVPAVLVCKICGSCFSAQEHLDRHLRHSHSSRPLGKHSCSYCPYTSNARVNVLAHERKHTGEKPFVCPVCKKRFTWKGSLAQHQSVHSDEKPFECVECGLRFPRLASLLRHRSLLHLKTGKPYACRHCGQCYRDKQNLRHHVKIHTGERPRACRFCGRNFLLLDSLREHERQVHGRWDTTGSNA